MMNCSDFLAELGNLLDGDTAADVRAHLEEHLSHCRACQVVYDSTRKTLKIVTDTGSFDLPDTASQSLTAAIMDKVRQRG
jgi:predicted anti-sigma-YlaC factor YlaD